MKGPVHCGQVRPPGIKDLSIVKDICTKLNGIPFVGVDLKQHKFTMSLQTHKTQIRTHMIRNGMFCVFYQGCE